MDFRGYRNSGDMLLLIGITCLRETATMKLTMHMNTNEIDNVFMESVPVRC